MVLWISTEIALIALAGKMKILKDDSDIFRDLKVSTSNLRGYFNLLWICQEGQRL